MDAFDLTGKVALVTGGSRGLGRAIVLGFARAGTDVIITSRKLDACEALAEEVTSTTGRAAFGHACHVGHWNELEPLVDAAYGHFGRVDILVNNAGGSPVYQSETAVTEELYDKVLALNLKGPFRLTALVGERMAAGEGGSIINISSFGSLKPRPGIIPYAAAKAGLNAMTLAFAHAYGPKVRVNCIIPGAFATDATKNWDRDAFAETSRDYAMPRMGRPDEIVGAALYLASDASGYTTGALISVDGGAR